jgi:nicotinate-nucleotide--dimethylbenzimidazole phosphoribosyltransferase
MRDPVDPDHLLGLLRSSGLPGPDEGAAARARARDAELTKPAGALGRLEELAVFLAAWQGRHPPRLDRVRVAVFAGWHGIAARGDVSAYPAEVTAQMVANFRAGGAAVNRLAAVAGAELVINAVREGTPTADLTVAPAMSEVTLRECLAAGAGQVPVDGDDRLDLLAVGEMGIANTTSSAAIAAALYREPASAWAGPGTGLDAAGVAHKAAVVEAALARHAGSLDEPIEDLRRLGGHEIAAMAAPSRRPGSAASRSCSTGSPPPAAAAVLHALAPARSRTASPATAPPSPATPASSSGSGSCPLLDLGLRPRGGLGRRAGRPAACAPRSPATPAWRPSPTPGVSREDRATTLVRHLT